MRFSPICTRFLRISVLSLAGLILALGIFTPQRSQAQGLTLYSVAQGDDQLRDGIERHSRTRCFKNTRFWVTVKRSGYLCCPTSMGYAKVTVVHDEGVA